MTSHNFPGGVRRAAVFVSGPKLQSYFEHNVAVRGFLSDDLLIRRRKVRHQAVLKQHFHILEPSYQEKSRSSAGIEAWSSSGQSSCSALASPLATSISKSVRYAHERADRLGCCGPLLPIMSAPINHCYMHPQTFLALTAVLAETACSAK